eukprot:2533078-Amphidinium_carterae.1
MKVSFKQDVAVKFCTLSAKQVVACAVLRKSHTAKCLRLSEGVNIVVDLTFYINAHAGNHAEVWLMLGVCISRGTFNLSAIEVDRHACWFDYFSDDPRCSPYLAVVEVLEAPPNIRVACTKSSHQIDKNKH